MLLSRSAETLFWFARYLERAEALSRAVLTYEELGLDLPRTSAPNGVRLLSTLGLEPANAPHASVLEAASASILDARNPSSVLGALRAARENLRTGRVLLPIRSWEALNALYLALEGERAPADMAELLATLARVEALCHELAGHVSASMTRDDAYAFLDIGRHLERADMLLRLVTVLSELIYPDQARPFEDVRWTGLLRSVGAFEMYRRCHRGRIDIARALDFLLFTRNFPRSLAYCLDQIDGDLRSLPRGDAVRGALALCRLEASEVLAARPTTAIVGHVRAALGSLVDLNAALSNTYFSGPSELEAVAS